ncbi:MAG: electron transfer flavoprotein subunit alpha [Phascolarctobacterium sp.]|nr:electron transfer flavoprotein subunit alpha [Phascolarctobacterium sp.]
MAMIVDKETCVGCGACVAACPVGAISLEDKACIDADSCIGCGACVNACPVGAISAEGAVAKKEVENNHGTDLWVVTELENGEPVGVTYELIGVASDLAAKAGEKCCAVLVAAEAGDVPQKLIAAGADKVYVIADARFADYNTDLYTDAICQLVDAYKPSALLIGATADGRDLAPRIAARKMTGLCADCTELDIDVDNQVVEWTRPALGGNILATILCKETRPQMGTVRPKVFKAKPMDATRTGEVINFTCENLVTSPVELLKKEAVGGTSSIKIEDAEVICSGGRGMGSADNFKILEEMAALFENGTVAGSRAVVDEGWIGHSCQVGQSGKTVTPKIYFACGISGAIQHLAGMTGSDMVIAINKDANAPIFKTAQYGIVGDVNVILPKLIAKIKAYKEN